MGPAAGPPSLFRPVPAGRRSAALRRGRGRRAGGPRGVCPCGAEGRGAGRRDGLDTGSTRGPAPLCGEQCALCDSPALSDREPGVPRARVDLRRLSADGQAVPGHPVLACEPVVDPAHFLGTVYARAGFTYRGDTAGFRRQAPGYTAHGAPKRVYLRPLRRQAFARVPRVFDARAVGRRPAGGPQPAAAGRPAGAGGGAGRRPREAPTGGGSVTRWRPRGRSRCGV